jgi:tRNA(Ile)-lysidine synthetase-like protein
LTATTFDTKKRRAFQTLWSKLDLHVLPVLREGVVLAVSGGPDSRALLEAVALWPKRKLGHIVVACIDHGARKEAVLESQLVVMRAQRLGFKAYSDSICNIDGIFGENELRAARYQALKKIALLAHCQGICTAHHGDDDAEGYFMALMGVGGGELGASMQSVHTTNGVTIYRPFLDLSKQDLLMALSLAGMTDFVEDRLDEACSGMRARVRNQLLPEVLRKAPTIKKRLNSFGRHQSAQRELIERLSNSLILWHDEQAVVNLDPVPDKTLLISALWQILKKWCNNKDLRSCQPTIDALVGEMPAVFVPGLDPASNAFNLRDLSVKRYQFPGVLVTKNPKNIVVRRI